MHVNYVFLNVRFFLWFDAIAVFEAAKSLIDKVYWKECLHGLYILWRLMAVGEYERVIVFSLEVTLCVSPASENVKKRKSVWRRSIYRKYVSWNRLQKNAGRNSNEGRSFKHWSRGSPGRWFSETEYLRASAIFVSGTSGIPPILNYRSVSPINYLFVVWWLPP